jgi:hypothetical protein
MERLLEMGPRLVHGIIFFQMMVYVQPIRESVSIRPLH